MKKSKIEFEIELDDKNIPEKIIWKASDNPDGDSPSETRSISIALWDHMQKNTLRIDLWSKEMQVDEMKRFYVDMLGGLAQSVMNSTGDEFMAGELNALCEKFVEYILKENS
ncbi:MAG: gliding motility protein GldC [Cyclobacteriaceae bacterium]|nr:gliding motility protein GldC [Cyclobacteriaceae bacterium]